MKHWAHGLLLMAVLSGCSVVDVSETAQLGIELTEAKADYQKAAAEMQNAITGLTDEQAREFAVILARADSVVGKIDTAWRAGVPITPTEADALYDEAKAVYLEAERKITPILPFLTPDAIYSLTALKYRAERIDRLYQSLAYRWDQQDEAMKAGVELAILALKVGMLAL